MYSSACQKYTQHPKKPSKVNEEVEIFKYDENNSKFIIEELYDKDMNPIEIANKSDEIVYVKCNEFVKKDYMLRRLK